MEQQRICKDCNQKHNCTEIYRQLGHTQGKSVTFKVITAFLLPLITFIATMAIYEELTAGFVKSNGLHTILSFLIALSASFICVLISKLINRVIGQDR